MSRITTLLGLVYAIALLVAAPAQAQGLDLQKVPRLIAFQGYLEADGVPIAGDRKLTFRVYSASDQAVEEAHWIETHPRVGVMDGRFAVSLGSLNPINMGLDSAMSGAFDTRLWLGITVADADDDPGTPAVGTELVPRQEIHAQMFAVMASMLEKGATVYSIDCGIESLQEVISEWPKRIGPLVIDISGTCNENVLIRSRRVILRQATYEGAQPAVIMASTDNPGSSALEIAGGDGHLLVGVTIDGNGARRALHVRDGAQVFLQGVTVTNGLNEAGMLVERNASVLASNSGETPSSFSGNGSPQSLTSGIFVRHGSHVHLIGASVQGNYGIGIHVYDGSSAYLRDTTVGGDDEQTVNGGPAVQLGDRSNLRAETSGATPAPLYGPKTCGTGTAESAAAAEANSECTTVSVFRNSVFRVNGVVDLKRPSTNVSGYGRAIGAFYGSQVRTDNESHLYNFTGTVQAGLNSHMELRDVGTITGDVVAVRNSGVRLGTGSSDSKTQVSGDLVVRSSSVFSPRNGGVQFTGTLTCKEYSVIEGVTNSIFRNQIDEGTRLSNCAGPPNIVAN